jgi:poly [ADP-ribose] polymerase 10/14/15
MLPVWAGLGPGDAPLAARIREDLEARIAAAAAATTTASGSGSALGGGGGDSMELDTPAGGDGGGSFAAPSHWLPPTEGTDPYKPRTVELQAGAEFDEVAALFARTCGPPLRLLGVARVQSLRQWGLYAALRRAMGGAAAAGERRLFHGTHAAAVPAIVDGGFNRSHHGRNAVALGRGTYFALDAGYSAQPTYSPPGPDGVRHMFLARVLAGRTAVGGPAMVEPPPAAPGGPRYDSTGDREEAPRIVVTYNDAQALPEYLIRFAGL